MSRGLITLQNRPRARITLMAVQILPSNALVDASGNPVLDANGNYILTNPST